MKTALYKAENLFRPNELFYINRVNEMTRDKCVYHTHDFVEICYVSAGKGYHLVGDRQYEVFKGDLFIINNDIRHTFFRESEEGLITCNIVFKPSFLDRLLSGIEDLNFSTLSTSFLFNDMTPGPAGPGYLKLNLEEQKEFDVLVNNIYKEYTLKPNGYMSIIRAYMIQLIIKIVRSLAEKGKNSKEAAEKNPLVENIIHYLKEHFAERFSLTGLVLKSFFSKGHLCKVFKEATGMTMSSYVQKLRIDEACKLISSTDMKMTDIAYKAGFSDYKSFYRLFKKVTGRRPAEYRQALSKPLLKIKNRL
ncbi:MAG: AraC family transcriptional regulator [Bacillota bacterium]